ncbi:hypothetical protein FRB94_013301 [Tulasnella sp. JGI-2019a]|nr:hypothetical protein FRB94_013301 [Tulasnella sp. JGI-2019a]KAG9010405.1 hypothetical protein FRB93_004245 [Tulasnella sp. JGI-2019a]KAG9038697.1 hypothetical protein FRB95_000287 [Tulasnella sp. JGI-2019a]
MAIYSLFDTLTNHDIVAPIPASVDLIDFLLKALGYDVCEATRNIQSLYRFVSRARDVTKHINGLITKVDEAPEDFGDFEDFDTYTQMIGPLEDELFRVISIFPEENEDLLSLIQEKPPTNDLELLEPYNAWARNRKDIRDAYQKLHDAETFKDAPSLTPDDATAVTKYDDLAWLSQLADNISNYTPKGTPSKDLLDALKIVAKTFDDILQAFRTQKSPQEDSIMLAIRAAMVSFTSICMIDPERVATEGELQRRLQEPKETWKRAIDLLQLILKAIQYRMRLNDKHKLSIDWAAFEAYLMGDSWANLLPIVIQLLKYVGNIKRHYFSQSVTLVKLCINLEKQTRTKGMKTEGNPEGLQTRNVQQIETALDAAKAALDSAVGEASKRQLANQGYDESRKSEAGKAFDTAVDKIQTAYKGHKLTYDPELMTVAQGTDKKFLEKLATHWERIEKRSGPPVAKDMPVTITLCEGEPTKADGTAQKVTLADSETVDAIIWKLKPGVDLTKHSPRFYKELKDKDTSTFVDVPAGTKLSSISEVPLFLAVSDLEGFRVKS